MGILVKQNENRSQYQEKLAAELRERSKQQFAGADPIDQTKNSNYLKNTSTTSDRAWIWALVGVILVAGVITYLAIR